MDATPVPVESNERESNETNGDAAAVGTRRTSTVAPPGGRASESLRAQFKRTRRKAKSRRSHRARNKPETTHAPRNNNQFLMEEHAVVLHPVRARDSSFSVDSGDDGDYFYPLPDDEEDFLAREFSSVYEDAQSERLMGMSKHELMQEYLALQAKFDALAKRLHAAVAPRSDAQAKLDEQERLIRELRAQNQQLEAQLRNHQCCGDDESSVDSESDSVSSSSSSSVFEDEPMTNGDADGRLTPPPMVNGHRHHEFDVV